MSIWSLDRYPAESRRAIGLDAAASVIALALLLLVAVDFSAPLRLVLALLFTFYVPGRAIVSNWPRVERWSALGMSIVFSLGVLALLAMVSLWAGLWHPLALFLFESVASLAGLAFSLIRRHDADSAGTAWFGAIGSYARGRRSASPGGAHGGVHPAPREPALGSSPGQPQPGQPAGGGHLESLPWPAAADKHTETFAWPRAEDRLPETLSWPRPEDTRTGTPHRPAEVPARPTEARPIRPPAETRAEPLLAQPAEGTQADASPPQPAQVPPPQTEIRPIRPPAETRAEPLLAQPAEDTRAETFARQPAEDELPEIWAWPPAEATHAEASPWQPAEDELPEIRPWQPAEDEHAGTLPERPAEDGRTES